MESGPRSKKPASKQATTKIASKNRSETKTTKKMVFESTRRQYPVGMRFHPTDEELVGHYLHNRAHHRFTDSGGEDLISDCPEFYGEEEPWVIWDKYGGNNGDSESEAVYLFTNRHKMNGNENAKRFERKVGSGTWSGENSKEVFSSNTIIGMSRHFRYEGGRDKRHNGAWFMREYQITDDDVTVICCLRKNPRKLPPSSSTTTSTTANDDNTKSKRTRSSSGCDQDDNTRKHKRKRETNRCDEEQAACTTSAAFVDQKETNNGSVADQLDMQVVPYQVHSDDQDYYYPEPYPELPDFSMDELFAAQVPDVLLLSHDLNLSTDFVDQWFESNTLGVVSNEFQSLLEC